MEEFNFLEVEIGNLEKLYIQEGDSEILILEKSGNKIKVLIKGKIYDTVIKKSDPDNKKFVINVEGYDFPVKINEPIDQLIAKMGFLKTRNHSVKEIKAPMPGLVLDIYVNVGDIVEVNQNLLSLEAMKMENILKSQGQGTIREIKIKKGAAVEKNQILIVFE